MNSVSHVLLVNRWFEGAKGQRQWDCRAALGKTPTESVLYTNTDCALPSSSTSLIWINKVITVFVN